MHPAVLARRDVEAELVLVVDHHAIAAEVDPAVVRIAGDVEAAGADVAAPVVLVPLRRGGDRHVDVRAALPLPEDGTILDLAPRRPWRARGPIGKWLYHWTAPRASGLPYFRSPRSSALFTNESSTIFAGSTVLTLSLKLATTS